MRVRNKSGFGCCKCRSLQLEPALLDSIAGIHHLPMIICAWCPICKIHVQPIWIDVKQGVQAGD